VRPILTAEVLAVGSELLTPHRIDTNSLHLTAQLNELGIEVRGKSVVGDDRSDLMAWLVGALGRVDLVVATGGLGPTEDDLTREAAAEALGLALEEDAEVLRAIEERFARRKITMPPINRRQARVPRGAVWLPNPNGTAPGLWIEHGERVLVLLPGPPREMQAMFDASVVPRLAGRTAGRGLRRRVIKTTGWPESQVDEVAAPIYRTWLDAQVPIQTTILASPGQIELHLSAAGEDRPVIDGALDAAVGALRRALGAIVFSIDGRSLEDVVGDGLRERGAHISVAESCTGGLLLGRLTNVPGSSAWVTGGVVAYDNAVKLAELNVPQELLASHGAVSEPVAVAMAEGVRARLGTEIGVGVTGIAGPSGGTPTKPVGTVVIAVAGSSSKVRTFTFPGDRQMVRAQAVQAALNMVRRVLSSANDQ
jgi:nicotinamide-nucleotide amidase